jgi:hypothetical protein
VNATPIDPYWSALASNARGRYVSPAGRTTSMAKAKTTPPGMSRRTGTRLASSSHA